ncbi:MAG: hypothetical protein ABJD68_16960 [Nakamurella sp.]
MMAARLPWQRRALPPQLVAALDSEEHIQVIADLLDGKQLAASRFGLWTVQDDKASRLGWELVAKARLTARVLAVIPTQVVDEFPDGTQILIDEPTREYMLAGRSGLTDVVHTRVRRSVAASRHLICPGAAGWVVLRRVPGRDGLTRQVRLDPGADAHAPGFAAAVTAVADQLTLTPLPE